MLHFYFAINLMLYNVLFVNTEVIYNVVAPGSIRPYCKYNVAVSIHRADGPCELEVGIQSPEYNVSKIVTLMPMSTETIELEIEGNGTNELELTVKGVNDRTINNSTKLINSPNKPMIFIQMDKKIYKPGDVVHFRVLFLNEKTQPIILNNSIKIIIADSASNRVRIWKNVTHLHGVFTESFQLSEQPVLGNWNIEVHIDMLTTDPTRKTFEVKKYDLPKFEVLIYTPLRVSLADKVIRVSTWARYPFGKPVKGKATVSIKKIEKTIAISTMGHVEFNILREVEIFDLLSSKEIEIRVVFEEEITSEKQSSTSTIFLHRNNFIIEAVNQTTNYQAGKPITLTIAVQKLDGSPVQDDENFVEIHIEDNVYFSLLNKMGIAKFTFVLPSSITTPAAVLCKYLNIRKHLMPIGFENPNPDKNKLLNNGIELTLITKDPQLGKNVYIKVDTIFPIDYLIYIVTARGNIVKAEHIEVSSESSSYQLEMYTSTFEISSYTLEISPTFEMIPKASIFVQYFYSKHLWFEEITVDFAQEFRNTLEITTTNQARPGDNIKFQISTNPNSFVGLLAVDQRVLYIDQGNDLTKANIINGLSDYETRTPNTDERRYPGKISGLVTLTNANYPYEHPHRRFYTFDTDEFSTAFEKGFENPEKPKEIRSDFPETWIFENFIATNDKKLNFTKRIPDSLTSWIITGFSLNTETGIALTKNPTTIQVFKPFFISINLPYSVKQGEIISIPVLIFNYMNCRVYAYISMDNSDKEYEFIDSTNYAEEHPVDNAKRFKRTSIPSQDVGSVSFMIRPKITGISTIKVSAVTLLAADSVHQTLRVEPEGITQHQNRAIFIHLNVKQVHSETITIDIPANAVPQSEQIELSAIGDLIGLSIKYIDNLVLSPFGYGEQNMINFVPSILVLKYLQTINRNMPNVTKTAISILKIGYQRELTFKRLDGSFSAYGQSDNSGSTWLTAYVVRYFQQASKFIGIDQDIVIEAFDFLTSKQTARGNFAEFGHLFEFPQLNDIALSAFVLLAFLENKNDFPQYNSNIQKGLNFLIANMDSTEDTYTLSITALVLQKAKHPLADEVLSRLEALAKIENGLTWWSINAKRHKRKYSTISSSSDIEITSYIALAMLEKEQTEELLPIIKWLTMQRNSNGGFVSTQDTVVGLQALIAFAEKTEFTHSGAMDINYISLGHEVKDRGTITINTENSMMLMIHELSKETRQVEFTAKGNSSSLIQLSYKYNIVDKEPDSSFTLNISIRQNVPSKKLQIDICAKFVPSALNNEGNKTNMVVIEVTLPSGFTTSKEELDKIRDFETILFTETKKSDTLAIIYLRNLEAGQEKCLSVDATRRYDIAYQKPVPVVIYDYNNKDLKASEFYEVRTSLCDICEADECGANCKKN